MEDKKVFLYRYSDNMESMSVDTYLVLKETPCGYWITIAFFDGMACYGGGDRKWISKTAYKRYACLTKEEAILHYIQRKKRQLGLYLTRVQTTKNRIEYAYEEEARLKLGGVDDK